MEICTDYLILFVPTDEVPCVLRRVWWEPHEKYTPAIALHYTLVSTYTKVQQLDDYWYIYMENNTTWLL